MQRVGVGPVQVVEHEQRPGARRRSPRAARARPRTRGSARRRRRPARRRARATAAAARARRRRCAARARPAAGPRGGARAPPPTAGRAAARARRCARTAPRRPRRARGARTRRAGSSCRSRARRSRPRSAACPSMRRPTRQRRRRSGASRPAGPGGAGERRGQRQLGRGRGGPDAPAPHLLDQRPRLRRRRHAQLAPQAVGERVGRRQRRGPVAGRAPAAGSGRGARPRPAARARSARASSASASATVGRLLGQRREHRRATSARVLVARAQDPVACRAPRAARPRPPRLRQPRRRSSSHAAPGTPPGRRSRAQLDRLARRHHRLGGRKRAPQLVDRVAQRLARALVGDVRPQQPGEPLARVQPGMDGQVGEQLAARGRRRAASRGRRRRWPKPAEHTDENLMGQSCSTISDPRVRVREEAPERRCAAAEPPPQPHSSRERELRDLGVDRAEVRAREVEALAAARPRGPSGRTARFRFRCPRTRRPRRHRPRRRRSPTPATGAPGRESIPQTSVRSSFRMSGFTRVTWRKEAKPEPTSSTATRTPSSRTRSRDADSTT